MSKRKPGLYRRANVTGGYEWHIDKCIRKFGRLCESTGTDDAEEAERYLEQRVREIREAAIFGVRPRRKFREAATKYLTDFKDMRSISSAAAALKDLDKFIGEEWLDRISHDSFKPYIEAKQNPSEPPKGRKRKKPLAPGTLNRRISVARRVLNLSARLWRDKESGHTWLAQAPLIRMLPDSGARKAYPLDWSEQRLLFGQLAVHLELMSLFDVNTGLRDEELCGLQWAWEQRIPELDTTEAKRSVFVLPGWITKNGQPRVVVLNDIAQSVLERVRGQHPGYVFTWVNRDGRRYRLDRVLNSGWKNARRRAAAMYEKELGRPTPEGFKRVRVHDLRHTYGRRLRSAGVSREDRKDLLGHKQGDVTTDYSVAEIRNLLDAANRITQSRGSPALTVLRLTA